MSEEDNDDAVQAGTWGLLYDEVVELLQQFGEEDSHVPGDYWVHDSYWGYPQVKIYVHKLTLLAPPVIKSLQGLLTEFRDHELVVAVSVRGPGEAWPNMALFISADEIVDGLQRQYFPKEFQDIRYEGSRPMTDRDLAGRD